MQLTNESCTLREIYMWGRARQGCFRGRICRRIEGGSVHPGARRHVHGPDKRAAADANLPRSGDSKAIRAPHF